MSRILFLSTCNAARSQMAEAFTRARAIPGLEVVSAGLRSSTVHPMAVRAMGEVGIDLSACRTKTLDEVTSAEFDLVVALSAEAARDCATLPGRPQRVNWNLADPAAIAEDDEALLDTFRRGRDEVQRSVSDLFDRGYFAALVEARHCESLILDHISDGIIAHDIQRRIFYFNRAAQVITGYRREDVLGRDCHDVFPGNFCGGKCLFCEGRKPDFEFLNRQLQIATRNGERRQVATSIRTIRTDGGACSGVLLSFRDISREVELAKRVREVESFAGIIGRDKKMLEVFDLIRDLAETDMPVLIQGESGTGKELVAAAIHNEGPRAQRQFVPVNCGALPESLLESELFGHVKGSFTGAIRDKKGRFELADGGTIFLDEIGDISPAMQVKLMRVLQEGTFERVGSEQTVKVNVRLISATNKDLSQEIAAGRFREDLFYRLSVVPLWLPPLRERRNDIPLIATSILDRAIKAAGRTNVTLSDEALNVMMSYDWPGNVRELQNWVQFALVKCKGAVVRPEHLPPPRNPIFPAAPPPPLIQSPRRRKLDLESVRSALRQTGGNKVEAAARLGVSRATLYRFLDRAGDAAS